MSRSRLAEAFVRLSVDLEALRISWALVGGLAVSARAKPRTTHPASLEDIAPSVLRTAPDKILARLLSDAERARGPLHSDPSHPLRILQDWVQAIPESSAPGTVDVEESLRRRHLVVETAARYAASEGEQVESERRRRTATGAALLALNPQMEASRTSVLGDSLRLRHGTLPASAAPKILELWARVRDLLPSKVEDWSSALWLAVQDALHYWVFPGVSVHPDWLDRTRPVRTQILQDLASLARGYEPCSPGLSHALADWSGRADIDLDLEVDQAFATLFPLLPRDPELEPWRAARRRQQEAAGELGSSWASREPEEVARLLKAYVREAETFGHHAAESVFAWSKRLAAEVDEPASWMEAFTRMALPILYWYPLLDRLFAEKPAGWQDLLQDLLGSDEYRRMAATAILQDEDVPSSMRRRALETVEPRDVEIASIRGVLPLTVLRDLLDHPDESFAMAAAVGEWTAEPEGHVRDEVRGEWQQAILRAGASGEGFRHYSPTATISVLQQLFSTDSALAFKWLRARLTDPKTGWMLQGDEVYAAAAGSLDADQRKTLVACAAPGFVTEQVVPLLVRDSVAVYRCLLENETLKLAHHLAPLRKGPPDTSWGELAVAALDMGHDPAEIADQPFWGPQPFPLSRPDFWNPWREAFEELLNHPDSRLREVGRAGLQKVESRVERAREEKRHFEVSGRW